jgi:hypothetical protein
VGADSVLVNTREMDLRVRVPDPGVPWEGLELRVMRGGSKIKSQMISPTDVNAKGRVTIRNVPLKRGSNRLSVVFANATGVGPPSDTLTARLDDQPPRLKVTAPRGGTTLNAERVTVKGRTVPGLRAIVRNMITNEKVEALADGQGRFEAVVALKGGRNTIKVAVRDAAGNQNPVQVVVVRGNGRDSARISLSRQRIRRSALPRTIDARVTVLDAEGRPIRGARVDFTFGPEGQGTQVRQATTSKDGVAKWSGMRVVEGAALGEGRVSVLVTLPNGKVLRDAATFRVV